MENILLDLGFTPSTYTPGLYWLWGKDSDLSARREGDEWCLELSQEVGSKHYGDSTEVYTVLYRGNDEHVFHTLIEFHKGR